MQRLQLRHLRSPNPATRRRTAIKLQLHPRPDALWIVLDQLEKEYDPEVEAELIRALSALGDARAADAIIRQLQCNGVGFVRAAAARALSRIPGTEVLQALQRAALRDSDDWVRHEALLALVTREDDASMDIFFEALAHDSYYPNCKLAALGIIQKALSARRPEWIVRAIEINAPATAHALADLCKSRQELLQDSLVHKTLHLLYFHPELHRLRADLESIGVPSRVQTYELELD